MHLFDDDVKRDYDGPAYYSEDMFSYYNRSSRRSVAKIREVLEEWFARYPDQEKSDLVQRKREGFNGVFFELLLHELFLSLNLNPKVHLILSHNSHRPDFLLKESDGREFIFEATETSDETQKERVQARILRMFYDQINELNIKDYFLDLKKVSIIGCRQPSGKRFREFLEERLSTISYDNIVEVAKKGDIDKLPTWRYCENGIEIEVSIIPVDPKRRGYTNHRAIGVFPIESKWGNPHISLGKAIRKKAGRYGKLEIPFIIGINTHNKWGIDKIDEIQALFGTEEYVVSTRTKEPKFVRKPDGVWYGPKGPRYTRVSAILMCQVVPSNINKANIRLYHNPWATAPYEGALTQLPQAVPKNGAIKLLDGVSIGKLLRIPDDWLNNLDD